MKKFMFVVTVFILSVVLAACNDATDTRNTETPVTPPAETEELRTFTLEELSIYDGLEGRDAYVAVNNFVYDVTNSSQWPNGLPEVNTKQDKTYPMPSTPHPMA